jgi:hypothetical protein
LKELAEDPHVDASMLTELRALGERPSAMPPVREYIEGVARVHAAVREQLATGLPESERAISEARRRFFEAAGADATREDLFAVSHNPESGEVEEVYISMAPAERRQQRARKNHKGMYYASHAVRSE